MKILLSLFTLVAASISFAGTGPLRTASVSMKMEYVPYNDEHATVNFDCPKKLSIDINRWSGEYSEMGSVSGYCKGSLNGKIFNIFYSFMVAKRSPTAEVPNTKHVDGKFIVYPE